MPISPEDFRIRTKARVQAHYAATRTPLLLARLGSQIEKADEWPTDKGQRSLKQLITEACAPDLQIVFDRKSPAYIAVVTPDVRADVEEQIESRTGDRDSASIRLEDIVKPVLLAFCINVKNQPVYVRRIRPFRYEVGTLAPDKATEFLLVEPEYRRPGLRIDNPNQLSLTDRKDLESLIQKWATVHGVQVEQFFHVEQEEKERESGRTALDRLLAAQPHDVAQRMMIPADIAQILSRIH